MAELDRAAISVRLAESRDEAGLTQEEMAEALQRDGTPLHWRSVQNYESPKIDRVPWDLLDQWARITGTTKEWLLHGRDTGTTGLSEKTVERFEAAVALFVRDVARLEAVADRLEQEPPAAAEPS
jgi:transcriptional regulator with XRE-family HTH domain